ncbi:hypothetical protein [Clostridium sp. OS1-26]|uniref:hypothetical protein n=1 Tax=Clostridium sp. OS1-26 TaxID=3070681 RepID=UPI0027DFA715|nr:hypothetical protein [Clostridium sp. OS1-26]WML34872.1 hypothetical protein RCG18_27085 [Clostridium sp. OS1-26]
MKKVVSIIATALITCSLSACGNKNTANRTPGTTQGGTNINLTQPIGAAAFKDGVYLGEGNKTSQENHAAIVTVWNGKINNVVLKTLDNQGKEITTRSSYNFSTAGTNTTTTGRSTVTGTTNVTTSGVSPSGAPTTGSKNGIPNNATLTHSERVRQDLANAIVSQQTYNVTINNVGNDTFAVDNWKLAVSRALVGAKR